MNKIKRINCKDIFNDPLILLNKFFKKESNNFYHPPIDRFNYVYKIETLKNNIVVIYSYEQSKNYCCFAKFNLYSMFYSVNDNIIVW